MKVGLVTVAFNEERFIKPFLNHIPKWVDEKLVLVSSKPWQGKDEIPDDTDLIAEELGATVVVNHWKTEEEQRNAGQDYFHDCDWVVVLDPDEFLTKDNWNRLKAYLEDTSAPAAVVHRQFTYWKNGYVADPPKDYQMLIAVRPEVRFVDKRVVGSAYAVAPIELHHFSWARTDAECLSKISHYAHAHELNPNWYTEVWLADARENVHPLTPETLERIVPAKLPKELEGLQLWPK